MRLSEQLGIHRLRLRILESYHTVMVLLAVVVGLLGGLCAVGFRKFIALVQHTAWQMPAFTLDGIREHAAWQVILVPAVGGLLVGLITRFFAREAKGHGVPEVMEAVMLRGGRIRARVVAAKLVASGVCIGTGGSVGREGPIVQIGSALGSALGQLLHLGQRRLKTLVGCGAAAGIAATFNAPIAGVLFSAEVILGDFAPSQLTPIVISSVAATVVSHHFFADTPAFLVPGYHLVSPWELLIYGVLGLLCGLVALAFVKILYGAEDFFDGPLRRIPHVAQAVLGGLVIGVVALWYPEVMGVGYEAIEAALHEDLVLRTLLLLTVIKIFAVAITIGSGGSGGIFAPSLFIGAMLGGAVGSVAHAFWPDATATSGAYALVGAGAVVAAATHAPLTAYMIIFELTNDYKIIMPLMIACVIATMLASRLCTASIYTMKLIRRGQDVFRGRSLNVLRHLCARDVMHPPGAVVPANADLVKLVAHFTESRAASVFVVDDDGRLAGLVNFDDVRPFLAASETAAHTIYAWDIMLTEGFPVVHPDESLDRVIRKLDKVGFEVPVVADGRLVGVILANDVIRRYNDEMFKREMATSMVTSVETGGRFTPLPGAAGLSLAEVPVPANFVGRSCAELDLRNRYGVTVLLIKKVQGHEAEIDGRVPDAGYRFAEDDVMLAMGSPNDLRGLENAM
ncbi:chloride channel protein [bacterium]|nr:chloride channel protein [bacterium]